VVINPATPAGVLEEILPEVDQVLVMTVNPGFGRKRFLHGTLPKIRKVCHMVEHLNPAGDVEDGGVDATTAPLALAAGANVFLAGAPVFGSSEGIAVPMANLGDSIAYVRRV
jgi:ribulose-phosphate 3-epimerase